MPSASRPWWQQATALVSLGAGGAITGFSFVPKAPADLKSPSSMPVRLMALEQAAQQPKAAGDATLRSAIVKVANYYLRLAAGKTPAEMEAIIWQHDSTDGIDHGESCAAFASLTLELGAQVVGGHSWVTGGGSYPWPLHKWADVRVEPNPASPDVTSILQDAQVHHRWHPLGDGYKPQPGDWVLFDGHVEIVTNYSGGVLDTIGGDSLPNFSVNAHSYSAPLAGQGVVGFVNNGDLRGTADTMVRSNTQAAGGTQTQAGADAAMTSIPGVLAGVSTQQQPIQVPGLAAIPGMAASAERHAKLRPSVRGQQPQAAQRMSHRGRRQDQGRSHAAATSGVPGAYLSGPTAWPHAAMADTAVIPGLPIMAQRIGGDVTAPAAARSSTHQPSAAAPPARGTDAQRAFISEVAAGAVAAQRKYGVPASVTIAQAIVESGWGQSSLATRDHNLFGIKGVGPAGSDAQPTSEYVNGQQVSTTASFRVYGNVAESIDDHGRLLATSGYYQKSMVSLENPNAFASSLTGVYATDPTYGQQLISLMRQYDLYRYDAASAGSAAGVPTPAAGGQGSASQGTVAAGAAMPGAAGSGTPAASRRTVAAGAAIPGTAGAGTPAASPSAAAGPAAPSIGIPGTALASPAAAGQAAAGQAASGDRHPGPAATGRAPAGAAPRRAPAPGTAVPGAESPTTATPDPAASPTTAPACVASAGTAPSGATPSTPAPFGPVPSGPAPSRSAAPGPAPSGTAPARPAGPAWRHRECDPPDGGAPVGIGDADPGADGIRSGCARPAAVRNRGNRDGVAGDGGHPRARRRWSGAVRAVRAFVAGRARAQAIARADRAAGPGSSRLSGGAIHRRACPPGACIYLTAARGSAARPEAPGRRRWRTSGSFRPLCAMTSCRAPGPG